MENTTASDIIKSFESSFGDKHIIPYELEMEWLKKAIGRYSIELHSLNFDYNTNQFDTILDRYIIDTLSEFMHQYYQERQFSIVNKRISIVTKEVSIDGNNGSKTSTNAELEKIKDNARKMVNNQKQTAYL